MTEKDLNESQKSAAFNDSIMDINTDDNVSGTTHLTEPLEEDNELEKIKAELDETKDRLLRQAAEFDNYKRRNAKERIELMQSAGKEIIVGLLDVLDDCDRAQKQLETSTDINSIKEGVLLVFNKLRANLQSRGVKTMEAVDKEFNVDLHEAITEIPIADENKKGIIVDELVKGYYLNDKIIRHAKVVVGK